MFSESFLNGDCPLYETVTEGVKSHNMDKPQMFNPDAIQEINFTVGRHSAYPVGRVIKPTESEVKLLHYKHFGFDYLNTR